MSNDCGWQVLAQINWEQAGVMVAAVVAALGGQRGIERLITAWQSRQAARNGNGEGTKLVPQAICDLRHHEMERLQQERHEGIERSLTKIESAIDRLHERLDHRPPPRRGG